MNLPLQKSRIPFLKIAVAVVGAALGIAVAYADLKPWKDYQESDAVWWVTTVRQNGVDEQGQPIYVSAGAISEKRSFAWTGVAVPSTQSP